MKNFILIFSLLISSLVYPSCGKSDSHATRIEYSKLPASARSFFEAYFSTESISHVVDKGYVLYIKMKDGSNVDFDPSGDFKKVDMNGNKSVPHALIAKLSTKMAEYIDTNYPLSAGWKVEDLEIKNSHGQKVFEVEVEKGKADAELLFDMDGNIIHID